MVQRTMAWSLQACVENSPVVSIVQHLSNIHAMCGLNGINELCGMMYWHGPCMCLGVRSTWADTTTTKGTNVKKVYTVSTKQDEKATAKETQVTVDDTGATPDQLFDQAARTLIVTAQGGWRRNGSIPAQFTIMVKDAGTRQPFVATPDSIAAKASGMSAEERKQLIAKLSAMK